MRSFRPCIGFVIAFLLADSMTAGQGDTVVAEINGQKLTAAELEQKQGSKLLQARYQYYLAQREGLDQLIEERLLEMEARRENITVEQLLERNVNSKVNDPTEDQLQVYYEGLNTQEPFAAVRNKIRDHIHKLRLAKARTTYISSLRSQANIVVALAPPSVQLKLDDAPLQGPRNAPVVLVEFADYECPYCQQIRPEIKKLKDEFGDQLSVAFKDFPLAMHRNAAKAAEAARCAAVQGKFWEYHDAIFSNKRLEAAQLKEYARSLKLDTERFDKCLDSGEQAAAVQKDLAEAQRLGLTGTPSFFINGHFLSGAVKYATLRDMVAQHLSTAPAAAKQSAAR